MLCCHLSKTCLYCWPSFRIHQINCALAVNKQWWWNASWVGEARFGDTLPVIEGESWCLWCWHCSLVGLSLPPTLHYCLQIPCTGPVGLCRPFLCSARSSRLPSSLAEQELLQSVYVTTHFNAYHTSFLRISVFTCLWLPSYQSLFCRSRMKIEIVHTFNDSLHFSPKYWDSQCMLMKILNYFHYSNIVLFFDNTYLFRHYIFPVKLSQ